VQQFQCKATPYLAAPVGTVLVQPYVMLSNIGKAVLVFVPKYNHVLANVRTDLLKSACVFCSSGGC